MRYTCKRSTTGPYLESVVECSPHFGKKDHYLLYKLCAQISTAPLARTGGLPGILLKTLTSLAEILQMVMIAEIMYK